MEFGGLVASTVIDYPGHIALMVYTIGCNFRCPYCHNPELVDETVEYTIPEIYVLELLKSRKGLLEGVVITGGEPTMHGEKLIAFIKHVKELGFLVKLDSNGTNPEFLKRVIKEKLVDYIAMDIKAPLVRYHEIAGRPVNTEAIKESIAVLLSNVCEYEFRTTVVKALLSPEDVELIAKEIHGAKNYYLQKFVPNKILNPQFKRKTMYTDEEFRALQQRVRKVIPNCLIR